MPWPLRGRILWLDGDRAGLRTSAEDVVVEPAGEARPGDLVIVEGPGRAPRVVRASARDDYPGPGSEVVRLPRARLDALRLRSAATAAVRGFFAARDFVEVDVPLLVRTPGLEPHLDAVRAGEGWLITSPEYQMKRLLAAGLERIVSVCRCFRGDERGGHHQPEFTMVEWYRAWADLDDVLRDTEELVAGAAVAARGAPRVRSIGGDGGGAGAVDVTPPWTRMSVADAMERWAGVVVRGDEEAEVLAERVRTAGIDPGDARAWDDVFFAAFVSRVEPALAALDRPLVLVDWPAPLAALARRAPDRPHVAERFEAYVGGVELCNAFGELTDAAEQRARFEADQRARAERGKPVHPIDEKLIAALDEGLPPCAGNALGLDRLIMLLAGARDIRDVVWFAADEL